MGVQTNNSVGLTRQTKIVIGVVFLFAMAGILLRVAAGEGKALPAGADYPEPGAGTAQTLAPKEAAPGSGPATPASATGAVRVLIMTTDTKAEWLREATRAFTETHPLTAAGRPIEVDVLQVSGPDEFEEQLLDGERLKPVLASPGDISWIEKANRKLKDRGKRLVPLEDCPSIVYIPTGFAMWEPMAAAMGWPDKPIGWKDIIDLASDPQGWAAYGHPEWKRFTFGHTQPPYSTSAFNVLASLAYAAAGKTEDLTPDDVRSAAVVDAFRKVEQETFHYGSSTSGLLNLMRDGGAEYLHAAATSETAFLWTMRHDRDKLDEDWAFIFPAEGTFWSDNPTCILNEEWVTEEQREAAKIYRSFLLGPVAQEKAIEIGLRPVDPKTPLHCPVCLEMGTDPRVTPKTVPPLAGVSGETNAAILDVFRATKKKATVALLLDTSFSMAGKPIKSALDAAVGFLGRLHPDDEIEAFVFSDGVIPLQPSGRAGNVVEKLSTTVSHLYADGNTSLFDAVCTAVDRIETLRQEDQAAGESRLYAVVLLSDGKNTNSLQIGSEDHMFTCLPSGEDVLEVRIYAIAYGEQADKDLLSRIARRTHGKMWVGTPENIGEIYVRISAEQ